MGYYTNKRDRERIDNHLQKIASIHSNLGKTNTQNEMRDAMREQAKREEAIKKIDPDFYKEIVPDCIDYEDEEE